MVCRVMGEQMRKERGKGESGRGGKGRVGEERERGKGQESPFVCPPPSRR